MHTLSTFTSPHYSLIQGLLRVSNNSYLNYGKKLSWFLLYMLRTTLSNPGFFALFSGNALGFWTPFDFLVFILSYSQLLHIQQLRHPYPTYFHLHKCCDHCSLDHFKLLLVHNFNLTIKVANNWTSCSRRTLKHTLIVCGVTSETIIDQQLYRLPTNKQN